MSLLLDDRIGSKDLLPRLRRLGVSCTLARLPFADAAFVGRGVAEAPWAIGVELKTVSDLCSCILTGRLAAHQLPGLLAGYDDVWLVVEGRWRARADGLLEVDANGRGHWFQLSHGRQRWMYRDVVGYLNTMAMLGGVRLIRTESRDETARWLAALHGWWTSKELDQHTALHTFVDMKQRVMTRADERSMTPALLRPPSFARRVYAQFPGIGWERSQDIERAFPSVAAAVLATEKGWMQVPGVGKTIAAQIVKAVRGQEPSGRTGQTR